MNNDALILRANMTALEIINNSQVFLTCVARAEDVIPFLYGKRALTHSGPPIGWKDMCPAMRNAVCGAVLYEGWAADLEQSRCLAASGGIRFSSNNDIGAVGPMAGIISPSMPVFVFENKPFGSRAYVTLNEGLGKALRFGANDQPVIERLIWIRDVLGPALKKALELGGPVNITDMTSRAIQRGDECHNRNKAATSLFIRHIAPWLVRTSLPREQIADVLAFMDSNDHFFLNLSMGNCKATMDCIAGIEHCTIVSCMCSNGHEFGIKTAYNSDIWFASPAPYANGRYFPGYTNKDANPAMGDSYISEATGIGAFAMASALGIGRFLGISVEQAKTLCSDMYRITCAEHAHFKIPIFGFRGTPLGIDIRKVVESGTSPIINTGIAHREPGIGQIGAGIVRAPLECFNKALDALQKMQKGAQS